MQTQFCMDHQEAAARQPFYVFVQLQRGEPVRRIIKSFVDLYFSNLPYSEKAAAAQEKIVSALNCEFENVCAETESADSAFEIIVRRYAALSDMASLAGYSTSDIEEWQCAGETLEIEQTRKFFSTQRRIAYFIAFALILTVVNLFEGASLHWANFLFAIMWGAAAFIAIRSYRKHDEATLGLKYNKEAYELLCVLSDKYTKRAINGIFILFSVIPLFATALLPVLSGNMKAGELWTVVYSNRFLVEIPLVFCVKNILCLHAVKYRLRSTKDLMLHKHIVSVTIFACSFWFASVMLFAVLGSVMTYPFNIYTASFLIYLTLIAVYNFGIRKRITFRNVVVNKKRIAVFTAAALPFLGYNFMQRDTWYTQPYINSISRIESPDNKIEYDEQTGVYTITAENEDFRILQITDVHLGGSLLSYTKDIKALKATYALIEHTKPDLVIVTGDLTFPMGLFSFSLNNYAPVNQFAAFMRNIGIPWAFTYGNHDTETVATHSRIELNEVYKSLSYKTSGTLLYPYTQPEITGRSNQLIKICNADGSLNQALFLIDSNDYTGEGVNVYDYIHDDQVDWYAKEVKRLNSEEGKVVSSMVFFHVPLQQYRSAYELYLQGSEDVQYFFGANNEKMINKVCCSDHPSKLFDTMVGLGSSKAAFCGHDHYNNISLEYKGIRLTYGMSIDYLAMPGIENDVEQRGATLIILRADSSFDIEQVPLVSIGG